MAFTFNVCEVFQMAEQIERKAAVFCRKVVESFEYPKTRKVLLHLADWEEKHADVFAAIRKGLVARPSWPYLHGLEARATSTSFDPDNEEGLYLQAMADDHVFNVKDDTCRYLTGDESPQCILKTAVNLEKEALAFFLGLKAAVPKQADKDKVEVIIKAKMKHIGLLNQELQTETNK